MVLLGKKNGGSRTIAILATFYRMLMRLLSDNISEWDTEEAGPWDTALHGPFALRAHVLRAMEVELADHEDLFIGHFLWDMRKFYDSIRVAKLVPRLKALGHPVHIMIIGLIAHKAPRILVVGSCVSKPITFCGRSSVAGCQQSRSWARGIMHKFVESVEIVFPGSICHEHVDDLSQAIISPCRMEVYHASLTIGGLVQEGVTEIDTNLSDKSVFLCSNNIG